MATACKYFEEDSVYRINKKGNIQFGLILENSEYLSSDEEENMDGIKMEDWEPMKKGHVRIVWHPLGEEEVIAEKKVVLADRALMPGDVIRRVIKGKDTQRGYCRTVNVTASVQVVSTRQVLHNLDTTDLTHIEEFSSDVAVFLDSWVGIIKLVKSKLFLRCPDGSRCTLSNDEALDLDDLLDKREKGSEFRKYEFYPGQQLWGPVRCFAAAEWLHVNKDMQTLLSKKNKIVRVTVENIQFTSLGVHWQCRTFSKESKEVDAEQPKYMVRGEDLKRVKVLNIFEPCTLQLGDRCYYKFKDDDVLLTKDQWRKLLRDSLAGNKSLNGPDVAKLKDLTKCVTDGIESTCQKFLASEHCIGENDSEYEDVETDDGNTSDTASISSKSSTSSTGQGKKLKKGPALVTKILKKKKLKRAKKHLNFEIIAAKPGDTVVTETLYTSSKAEVVWQDGTVEADVPSTCLHPIHHLDEQEFFPGDFVVENKDNVNPHEYGVVKRVDHFGRISTVHWMKTYTEGADPHPIFLHEEEVSVYDLKDHPDFKYRPGSVVIRVANFEDDDAESTAGQVLDVHPTGMVEVHWVSGKRSCCYPQELYKVGEYDSDEGELWDDGESEDSWETESEQSVVSEEINHHDTAEDASIVKPKLAANIEKARLAMARLEEIFTHSPTLQSTLVMKQLLEVYKDCKCLDRIMGTAFFHDHHFHGLLQRVRERGRINSHQRMNEQLTKLFKNIPEPVSNGEANGSSPEIMSSNKNGAEAVLNGECAEDHASSHQPETSNSKPEHICATFCSLLKSQLLKAHEEVVTRYGGSNTDVTNGDVPTAVETTTAEKPPPAKSASSSSTNVKTDKESNSNEEVSATVTVENGPITTFSMMETVPDCHKYKLTIFEPNDFKMLCRSARKEIKLLRNSLPDGIIVKGFDERMDLFSVMIRGPTHTPYEDGLFLFDFQLCSDYPKSPPFCHYISYCTDRLNPNLYEDGKVCVSLLGTWGGKGTEVWTSDSNLLQVIVSIQGLILVTEPYFNEAGYDRQKGTQQGKENSRMYNEMVILKLVQSMTKLLMTPPETFRTEILAHFQTNAHNMIARLEKWLEISESYNNAHPFSPTTPTVFRELHGEAVESVVEVNLPEFPLIPASKGFCITLHKTLAKFRDVLSSVIDNPPSSSTSS